MGKKGRKKRKGVEGIFSLRIVCQNHISFSLVNINNAVKIIPTLILALYIKSDVYISRARSLKRLDCIRVTLLHKLLRKRSLPPFKILGA